MSNPLPAVFRDLSGPLKISASTIDRLLLPTRINYKKQADPPPNLEPWSENNIPSEPTNGSISPRFLEADTVAIAANPYPECLPIPLTALILPPVVWTKSRLGKEKPTSSNKSNKSKNLYLPLLGFDCDNGGRVPQLSPPEAFAQRKRPIQFTRSRAYHKDDNAHVEQKNWTHVRQWLGYQRLDDPKVVPLLNGLYRHEWRLFHNFFCPSVKLLSKEKLALKPSNTTIVPKLPTRESSNLLISSQHKQDLSKQLEKLNPLC